MILDVERAAREGFIGNTGGLMRGEVCEIVEHRLDGMLHVKLPQSLEPERVYIVHPLHLVHPETI